MSVRDESIVEEEEEEEGYEGPDEFTNLDISQVRQYSLYFHTDHYYRVVAFTLMVRIMA